MQFYCEDFRDVLGVLQQGANRLDPYAVRRTCAELTRLVLHRNAVRHEMVAEGQLLPELVEIVTNHAHEERGDVLADCLVFFQRLISLKQPTELDIQSKITQTGCLHLIVKGLTLHPNVSRLYVEGCKLVTLLCFDTPTAPHADNQTEIADAGLFEAICARLETMGITEEEAAAGCSAVAALVYEHDTNADIAIRKLKLLSTVSTLLAAFPESLRVVKSLCQTLFQLTAMEPCLSDDIVDAGVLQQVVAFLDSEALSQEQRDANSFMVHWHVIKLLELTIRHNDVAKDEFCGCGGPSAVVNALIHRSQRPHHVGAVSPSALQYISCMMLCRLATTADDPPAVAKDRAKQLVQCGAHQLSLDILRAVGLSSDAAGRAEKTGSEQVWAAVEQAVRLLELIATVEVNRIPLTRLGASRQVKLVYNNLDAAELPGLLLLCERAVANIEGT